MPVVVMAALGGAAVSFPELLGNGYDAVDRSLLGTMPLTLLLVLPALKFLATALCSSAGVPGGLFTPSLYVGALAGGALGVAVERVLPGSPSGAYALIGMGCILAGTTHAAVSSVLIVFELTGDYDVILPLMVACVLAAHVARALFAESIYTASLRRRNVVLPEHPRPEWFRAKRVESVYERELDRVPPELPFADVLTKLIALPAGRDLYVVADDGTYVGAIVLDALKGHLPDQAHLGMLVAADLVSPDVSPVSPELALGDLARRFVAVHVERLPVAEPSTGRLLGTVSKNDLFKRGRF
jgi:CIC family chloride channel protein